MVGREWWWCPGYLGRRGVVGCLVFRFRMWLMVAIVQQIFGVDTTDPRIGVVCSDAAAKMVLEL